jgi:hypothetical protein
MSTLRRSILPALYLFSCIACLGQTSAGGGAVQGTVKDPTGAAIPGAKIRITHRESGVATSTVSNNNGYFTTPSINIGPYQIRVEAQGMKAWEGELQVETGRTVQIDPVLQLGQVSETVTVEAVVPLVTTTDPTEGSTLDARRISEMPINGRDLNTLLVDVTPGLETDGAGLRTGGLMLYSTTYMQDGAAANNREFGGGANLQGLDSIGEVRVETSSSSAKYNSPASVIVTTKSGTNRIRGSLYETMRNSSFGVARARQDVFYDGRKYEVPRLIRNEFGGTIGGPVYLPTFGLNGKRFYHGRNRTFFFFSREGVELRQGTTRSYSVPTAAMREGDFSSLYDSQGRRLTLYDPLSTAQVRASNGRMYASRTPFVDNRIPVERRGPLATYIYNITPLPNDITNPVVTANLKLSVPSGVVSDSPATSRLDHRISDRNNLFVKFNGGRRQQMGVASGSATGVPTANYEANVTYVQTSALAGAFNWTHIFTPTLFVETLVSRSVTTIRTVTGPEQKNWSKELGLPNPLNEIGWPSILNVSFTQYVEGDNRRSVRSQVTNAEQNYSYVRGAQSIQFGVRYHLEKQAMLPDQNNISGTAYFNSLATAVESPTLSSAGTPQAVSLSGYDAANFFLGYAARFDVGLKRGLLRINDRNYAFYLQDNYRATNRLTLNLGLRWDLNPAFTEDHYLINAFDVASHQVVLPKPLDYYYQLGATSPAVVSTYQKVGVKFVNAAELGRSEQIFQSNWFDVGPRAGFAYRAFEGRKQFILRGGYGIYISPMPVRSLLVQFQNAPPFRATFSYEPNNAARSPDGQVNWLLRNTPTYIAGANSVDAVSVSNPNDLGVGQAMNALGALPSMKVHEWNFTIERQLRHAFVLRLRYNGKHGVNTDQLKNLNPQPNNFIWYTRYGVPLPAGTYANVARRPYDQTAYTDVNVLQKTGMINTNSFSVEFERRFTRGLGFQAFYTMTNSTRLAGNSFRDGVGSTPDVFLPGAVPTDPAELNRFLYYQRDTALPKHRVRWNWNYDLPFGRGRSLARNAPRWLNHAIGGWKFSGTGTVVSTWFAMPTNQWGEMGTFELYRKQYPILDCRSTPTTARTPQEERCFQGYLYFNGYISERYIDSRNTYGMRNGVFGLPDDYKPAQKPVNPWPKGGKTGDPGSSDWDTNNVYIILKSGARQQVAKDTNLHPWRNQYIRGPFNWLMDGSMLKFFQLTERARLRLAFDMFNLLNNQGLNVPSADGVVTLQNSYSGFGMRPRQVQISGRIEW